MAEAEAKVETQVAPETTPIEPQETLSPQQYYQNFKNQIGEWWTWACNKEKELSGWDERWARNISDFKKEYILSIGDLINRSICMAIAGGLTYKLISINNPSLIRRTRNLGISFLVSGWLFVPELFNPYLPRAEETRL